MGILGIESLFAFVKTIFTQQNMIYAGIIGIVLMGAGLFYQHNKIAELEQREHIAQSNEIALTDTLRTVRTDYGAILSEKGALQVDKRRLSEVNKELGEKIKQLENDPITVTIIETVVERDTIYVDTESEFLGDSRFQLSWSHSEEGHWGNRLLEGVSRFEIVSLEEVKNVNTSITRDVLSINITTGFRQTDDGMLRAYVESSYPNIRFNNLNAAIVDPSFFTRSPAKDKVRLVFGPFIGVGWDYELNSIAIFGMGVTYNILRIK